MLDFAALQEAVTAHTQVVRLVIAHVSGSSPREQGTSMLVWEEGQRGTIGGGRLEYNAVQAARAMIEDGVTETVQTIALQPEKGARKRGVLTVVFEAFDATGLAAARSASATQDCYIRQVEPGTETPPNGLLRHVAEARVQDACPCIHYADGWLSEPLCETRLPVFIYGAGHVGRTLAVLLAPLPQFTVHLCDVREDQFGGVPDEVQQSWDTLPTDIMARAPDRAAHVIMTPEPEYDLELCHRLLSRSFAYGGLIGSQAKWERFRKELVEKGHAARQIDRIHCPIGAPSLGKHPQAIAIGVAAQLLDHHTQAPTRMRHPA